MEETMMNSTTEEFSEEIIEEEVAATETDEASEDPFREAVEVQMRKIQRQGMLIGAQTILRVVLDKIVLFKKKQGKPTMNDYKRLVKDIEGFCTTGLSRKVNADGETEPIEETVESETIQN